MVSQAKGRLYIIKSEEGPVKIGISIDPEGRIKKLSATSGRAIMSVFISPAVPDSDKLEDAMHRHFHASRSVGEWFDIDFQDAVRAAHHLGARQFPNHWRQSSEYMQGTIHRDRMRKFAQAERSLAEWDAFFAGMGDAARSLADMVDDVDVQAALYGMAELQRTISAAGDDPVMVAAGMSIVDSMKLLRDEVDADMVAGGLKNAGEGLSQS